MTIEKVKKRNKLAILRRNIESIVHVVTLRVRGTPRDL